MWGHPPGNFLVTSEVDSKLVLTTIYYPKMCCLLYLCQDFTPDLCGRGVPKVTV